MGNRTGLREREREREREKWSDFGIPPRLRRKRGNLEEREKEKKPLKSTDLCHSNLS